MRAAFQHSAGAMSYLPPAAQRASARLPSGVSLRPLSDWSEHGGRTIELYRDDWKFEVSPVQWNLVSSRPNTLRGVHAHVAHWDYLCVIRGEMLLNLHDMRPDSSTYRLAAQQLFPGDSPINIAIPPGVAHGFYFAAATTYFYAVSHYWNPSDELGCRWDDPELGFSWPTDDPLLSPRDTSAPRYGELARELIAALDPGARRS
jgi:dTDP-4-dehydrorhamnose 3,5-epimerase